MYCRHAPSRVPDQWSLDDKLLSQIVCRLANLLTNDKSSAEKLSSRRSRTISFLGDGLSAGSFGCGNDLVAGPKTAGRLYPNSRRLFCG